MTGSFYRCDGPYCIRQEDTEVIPDGWIAVSIAHYVNPHEVLDQIAHFCGWRCFSSWAYEKERATTAEAALDS